SNSPLDRAGIDGLRSKFIELWIYDGHDAPRTRDQHVKLRLDLGAVSEHQMRAPGVPPNPLLDSEDKAPRDNQLTVTDQNNEDTGYDGLPDGQDSQPPLHLTPPSDADPQ